MYVEKINAFLPFPELVSDGAKSTFWMVQMFVEVSLLMSEERHLHTHPNHLQMV
jgi:hypothetical protein